MKQIAFYKGPGRFFDKVIREYQSRFLKLGDASIYSHTVNIIDGQAFEVDAWSGRVISRPWEGNYYPPNYDIVEVTRETRPVQFLIDQVGKRYDYPGVVGFILPFRPEIPNWLYCSEFSALWLMEKNTRLAPGEVAKLKF